MKSDWLIKPLEDCMEKIIDYRGKTPKKTTRGIPLITAKIIKNGAIQPVSEYIDEEDYVSWMRRGTPEPGDVVMTTEAPLGEVAQLDSRKVALAQRVITMRGKRGLLDNTYLRYMLQSKPIQVELNYRASGTTVIGIRQSELRKVPLILPPYSEQRAIARVLKCLDDKISNNRAQNSTLESIAHAIFKSWFVDFDPVKAKMEGRHPRGMNAETAALFPDRLADSDLGLIPEGWKLGYVQDIIEVNPKEKLKKGTPAPYVEMSVLPTSGLNIGNPRIREFGSGSKFRSGDTLMARITPCLENGKGGLFFYPEEDAICWGSTEFIVLRPRKGTPRFFPYLLTRNEIFRQFAIQHMFGTSGRQRVSPDTVINYMVVVPPEEVLLAFDKISSTYIDSIRQRGQETDTLVKLRDTLLPRLISGKLRIKDAEIIAA